MAVDGTKYDTNALGGAPFFPKETLGLAEPKGQAALETAMRTSCQSSLDVCWSIPDWPDWRQRAHDVKAYTIAHLDELLAKFADRLEAKGVKVLWARDAADANAIILDIAKKHQVKTVVKGKSMVSEELELNKAFAMAGISALETDLGEFIVQLTGKRPTHIVTPATHLSAEEVGELFAEKLGVEKTTEHEALTMIARKHLREKFVSADMGISGINFGIAESGSFCLVENEGNIGLSTTCPKVHVALMGIEKLIPSLDYLPLFLNMLPRMGTGQKLTSYTHIFNGPTEGRTMYVVIVDNGRTRALASPAHRKVLHCIRCGGCMARCPVYQKVGGWAYGWVYPGPLGIVLTPQLLGYKTAGKLPFASSLCGACSQICPVKIDLAHQVVRSRAESIATAGSPARSCAERLLWWAFAWGMQSRWRYNLMMLAVKLGIRVAPALPIHPWLMGRWTRGRALPVPPKEGNFARWWKANHK